MPDSGLEPPRVVAVTGASGYVGAQVLRALAGQASLERLVAIDVRAPSQLLPSVVAASRSVTGPLEGLFNEHRIDTVVHLAFVMRPARNAQQASEARAVNVGGTENVLRACVAAGVRHVVYLSSHTVYGAHRDNPVPLTEDAFTRPNRGFQYGEHKAEADALLRECVAREPRLKATVLRCCVVMGPTASNFVTQALFKPFLVRAAGADPPMQFVHEDDVGRLLCQMVMQPRPGVYNVAGEGTVSYSEVSRLAGIRCLPVPAGVLYPLTQLAWKLGIQKDSPAVGLDLVRYPVVVSTQRLKEATGFRFQHTSREALLSFVSTLRGADGKTQAAHRH